jgi:DNA invertase Pin-like site-specific DNA recombinase
MKTTTKKSKTPRAAKKMVLYARVSTEEQTRGNYPSCASQIEELESECLKRGWEVYRVIKDEGFSAGSLKRPGLTGLRWLVQSGEVNGVMCTWYDRLTRSREFYTLDTEFQAHNVEFVTLHDPADTRTAAGRFMESMIVAAKTYERDQTSEKVRIKMRLRQEKGLHQGGLVPFGFTMDQTTKMLHPDPDQAKTIEQIFRTYVDTRSDFAVRDWLQAHGILSPRGQAVWRVSTLRDLLSNRRYIGEIELNRKNKNVRTCPKARPTASSRPHTGRWCQRSCGRWRRPCARRRRWSRPTAWADRAPSARPSVGASTRCRACSPAAAAGTRWRPGTCTTSPASTGARSRSSTTTSAPRRSRAGRAQTTRT